MKKVLLLEDETMIQMLIEDYISDLGYDSIPTSSLDEASAVDVALYDFALLDVNLGDGTTSLPLARRLFDEGKPFAFMTGYNANTIEGFDEVVKLSKPINFAMLDQTLSALSQISTNIE